MASTTLSELLSTLKVSIDTAAASLCEPDQLQPPANGISLLDAKNELFLSYLQNLVFLIILKLRQARNTLATGSIDDGDRTDAAQLRDQIVGKLVELRVYLEKGVKPLESRLRYQIDKVVRAADDAALKSASDKVSTASKKSREAKANGKTTKKNSDDSKSDGSSEDDSEEDEIDPLAYRPNPAAFAKPDATAETKSKQEASSGIYKPPRITATAMPGTIREQDLDRRVRRVKTQRSATLDEYVANELSTAPIAEPSIGTMIREGGRRHVDARERKEQRERDAYEEAHFVRLPMESKAERRKKQNGRRERDAGWGGEDWRDIERGADRLIGALNRSKDRDPGSKVRAALERSRKRTREDPGTGSNGVSIGDAFEQRRHKMQRQEKRRKTR